MSVQTNTDTVTVTLGAKTSTLVRLAAGERQQTPEQCFTTHDDVWPLAPEAAAADCQ